MRVCSCQVFLIQIRVNQFMSSAFREPTVRKSPKDRFNYPPGSKVLLTSTIYRASKFFRARIKWLSVQVLFMYFLHMSCNVNVLYFNRNHRFRVANGRYFQNGQLIRTNDVVSKAFNSFIGSNRVLYFTYVMNSFLPVRLSRQMDSLFFSPISNRISQEEDDGQVGLPSVMAILSRSELVIVHPAYCSMK